MNLNFNASKIIITFLNGFIGIQILETRIKLLYLLRPKLSKNYVGSFLPAEDLLSLRYQYCQKRHDIQPFGIYFVGNYCLCDVGSLMCQSCFIDHVVNENE